MSGAFSATLSVNGNANVALAGELDMATAPELARALAPLVDAGPPEIVLELSALSFIDSSGVSVLVDTQQQLTAKGRHLSISGAKSGARRVFEIAGLVDYLHVRVDPAREADGS